MPPPKTRNEVQSLTGKIDALARFISRLTDECAPFFKLLKTHRTETINWGPEHDKAFQGLRDYLASVPTLSKPIPGRVLYIYLTVAVTAISAALVRRDDSNELPVYYTGKGFNDTESSHFHQFAPSVPLLIIVAPWAYCQWGLDFIDKFLTAPGQLKFAIVAVDYNTKWFEAEALATITVAKVINFLWKNIYCLFRIPETIIIDNGAQIDNDTLRDFVGLYGTQIQYASPAHPQTNGQVKAVNKIIKQNLKKRLDNAKGLWAEKLPEVLWAIRTTITKANGESPFCLSFSDEAVIPVEQEVHSERVACFDPLTN
ncbi:uncharacterized protein K02A2.6-like [Rosa chinensis]|uniref:uncharacterized protein K02A2.6-like n=1 Tax=Rosa chinensis TaxID=74649 RepID=UPI000D08D58E|nr:uncharacterized protein K02A2.6-like [Rosa chinensis]